MEHTEDREIRIVRTCQAPISLVWKAWTSPECLVHWWGPDGFTSTMHRMDFRKDGEWSLTLHGPDGTNYPNRSIFREIIPFQKIVFEHFHPHFITTVLFEAAGAETHIDWTLLFDTAEVREIVGKVHNAEEGQQQNVARLEKYLSEMPDELSTG